MPGSLWQLGYLYELGLADGRGNTQFNDDVSYRLHAVSAGTDLTLTESLLLHLAYIYRRKDFTSELIGDTHLNRHDDTHQGAAEMRYRVSQAAMLTLGFQHTAPQFNERDAEFSGHAGVDRRTVPILTTASR